VSERKRKRYDIKEIHEFIDSASTATQQMHYTHSRKNLETKRKKRSDEPTRARKHIASSESVHKTPKALAPRVVVRKRESVQKEEEIVFRVTESPKTHKKQEVITLTRIAPAEEDLFSEEAQYEIEPYSEEESRHKRRKKEPKPSSSQKDVTPTVALRGTGDKLPEWKPVEKPMWGKETWANDKEQKKVESLPEFERVDEDQAVHLSQDEDKMPPAESLDIEVAKEQKPLADHLETRTFEDKRKKKAQEKQTILELRLQEKEAQRLKKEQEKKAILELRQQQKEAQRLKKEQEKKAREEERVVEQKLQTEERLKDEERKKAAAEAREKQREEHHLLKEREKNLRIQQQELKKKEKEERKQQKAELKRTSTPTKPVVSEASPQDMATSDEIPSYTSELIPETSTPTHDENHPIDSFQQPIEKEVMQEEPLVPATPPEPAAPDIVSPREDRREQKRLRKEQKQKQRLERIALKEKEKQERQQRKQQERLPERIEAETIDKAEQERKKAQEKQAQRDAKKQEREMKKQQKAQLKQERLTLAAQDLAIRRKEKEQQQQQEEEAWQQRQDNADLQRTDSREQQADNELQKAVEQQQANEAEQQAIEETKEQRKLKAVERKMRKEQEKKEKEAQKLKTKEEENAKKRMELHFEEEVIKEEQSDSSDRITIFDGFDTIDQEIAKQLYKHGYTSVEKLLQATLEDLRKIGIKKKMAKDILTECLEFVEWKVMDAEKPNEKLGGIL
jgi:hypothetical protein